jgi:hypothetical protein
MPSGLAAITTRLMAVADDLATAYHLLAQHPHRATRLLSELRLRLDLAEIVP